jgi:hypothetical protein
MIGWDVACKAFLYVLVPRSVDHKIETGDRQRLGTTNPQKHNIDNPIHDYSVSASDTPC